MQTTNILLWAVAVASAVVMSIGFSVLSLSSSPERQGDAFRMLPLYLQSNAPRSGLSRVFIGLMGIAFVGFYVSILALFFVGSWVAALLGGAILFLGKFSSQTWWVRNTACRPMKPFLLYSVVLVALILATLGNVLL